MREALESTRDQPEMLLMLFKNRRLSSSSPAEGQSEPEEQGLLKHFLFEAFYRTYFRSLKQMDYEGGVIMHGLEEQEVDQRALLLGRILNQYP